MKRLRIPLYLTVASLTLFYCQSNKHTINKLVSTATEPEVKVDSFDSSPFLSPQEAMKRFEVTDGFKIQLIAAEPLVSTPVAMIFDDQARMYVAEMTGYMPDSLGTGEEIPNGNIVILEDSDKNGVYDKRKVLIDSLVLPRALCLIDDGILVAEPTNLWFYKLDNDQVVGKELVDPQYTEGGNVEHQPNGLLRAMDNWIYNAKSAKRYRKLDGKWVIERTHFRGQWGITQDNNGRIYYNNNSQNLLGDYFAPGLGAWNKNQKRVEGYNEKAVANNKVYPIRPTPGVNRGYMKNILNDQLKLNEFTAASGPMIYRGDLFGKEFAFNSFVPEPSANLIKRNIMSENGYEVHGEQAYTGKEFIASTDERFRPVNLYNAPDGSMIILDMYRGIIQHKTYLTPYLKNQIGMRELTQPLSAGRIYKVVPTSFSPKSVVLSAEPTALLAYLGHENGWIRDRAQQNIIDRKITSLVPKLKAAMAQTENELMAIHALWTLEGLGELSAKEVVSTIASKPWVIRRQAYAAVPSVISAQNEPEFSRVFAERFAANDTLSAPYLAYLANYVSVYNKKAADDLLVKLAKRYANNPYVADAIISNLQDREDLFEKEIANSVDSKSYLISELKKTSKAASEARKNRNPDILKKQFPKGEALFTSVCQTCHGPDGNGVASLAPPLNQSEWVTGDKNRLISVVLFGLTGPVTVNGHMYQTPEVSGDMPGIGYDDAMQNEDIAQLLSYIRKSWRNNADVVSTQEVSTVRKSLAGRENAFTETELNSRQ
ncbi:cbb3-type cytochrome c oxidase subunit III [Dyadobacter jejuensis]|uniref:Cbb3-type cytochrome c oxidase subunit III n=1 Tax=Dyadobacter jejuensis TaxID=1082580 RepID=A0A316AN23_9BACT|nr:c-type cytochrome [Dyadobacter jejuensis]PWJ58858.1 cbb3-type cytochrome c oxidase subunit III [Dyadobacter jejuensis]